MVKKIIIGVVVVLVVAAGGLYFLYSNLGSIIKAAIEKYGSEATQAQVTVNSVTLSATSGQGAITGLVIGNPQGFSAPRSFELGSVSLTVDTSTITQNPVVIKEVVITGPKVTYEQGNSGGNLQKIQQNVMQYAGGSATAKASPGSSGGNQTPPPSSSSSSSGGAAKAERKLIIDKLDVTGGEVTATATMLQGRTVKTSLPAIHLTDIGRKEGGATPAEVTQRIISAISDQAAKAAVAELQKSFGNVGGAVQDQLNKAGSGAGGAADRLKGLLGK